MPVDKDKQLTINFSTVEDKSAWRKLSKVKTGRDNGMSELARTVLENYLMQNMDCIQEQKEMSVIAAENTMLMTAPVNGYGNGAQIVYVPVVLATSWGA